MTGYEKIELENIRRTAERGLAHAKGKEYQEDWDGITVDLFQNILDLVGRVQQEPYTTDHLNYMEN